MIPHRCTAAVSRVETSVLHGSAVLGTCLVLLATGCGKDVANRAAIGGKVTLDGRPLEQGSILFLPVDGARRTAGSGDILNGEYRLPQTAGPTIGWNRVEIRAVRKTGKMVQNPSARHGQMIEEQAEAVPTRFNSQSTLKFEVAAGDNAADFAVTSK